MKGGSWTPEEDATICRLKERGWTWPQIGKEIHREPYSCSNRWYRLCKGQVTSGVFKGAFWTFEEDEAIRDAWTAETLDIPALPKELGRTVDAIEGRASSLGLRHALSKKVIAGGEGLRRCHDCGKLTHNYRCPACLRRWRDLHGVGSGKDEGGI